MILKSLVLLITIITFVVPDTDKELDCYYSRFMLYFFTMHGINFHKLSTVQEKELQLQGNIVIAMIEKLMETNPLRDLQAYMKLNLYLNHVFKYPMITSTYALSGNQLTNLIDLTSRSHDPRVVVKESFQTSHEDIIKYLTDHVSNCNCKFPIVRDSYRDCPKEHVELNYLLPESFQFTNNYIDTDGFIRAVKLCNLSSKTLGRKLKAYPKRAENSIFNPKKMFFYEILETYKDGVAKLDTRLDLLRNVGVNGQLEDGRTANIKILYEMIKHSFEPRHIPYFQQQVLAATVHPVLECIGSYLLLFKQIYYIGNDQFDNVYTRVRRYGGKIDSIGVSVVKSLKTFIGLKLLPENVQTHLAETARELNDLNEFANKENIQTAKLGWIETIYRRCSVPMQLNLLLFDDYGAVPMNINTKDECEEIIHKLKAKTDKLDSYISALEKHKNDFLNVTNKNENFAHMYCDMFEEKLKYDIVSNYKYAFDELSKLIPTNKAKSSSKHLLDM